MATGDEDLDRCIFEAEAFRDELVEEGWTQTPSYDLVSPTSRVWAQTTFTTGEYTLSASRKPRGYGPHDDVIRVRVTSARAESHPGIGVDLARGLIDFEQYDPALAGTDEREAIWPPYIWEQHLEVNT